MTSLIHFYVASLLNKDLRNDCLSLISFSLVRFHFRPIILFVEITDLYCESSTCKHNTIMDNNFSNAHKALENSNLPDMSAGFNKSIDSDQQDSHLEWMKFSAEHVFRDEPSYGAKFPFERFPAYENPSPIEVDSLVTFGFAEKYIRLQQSTYKTLKKQKKNEEKSISLSSRKTKKNNIYTENKKKIFLLTYIVLTPRIVVSSQIFIYQMK